MSCRRPDCCSRASSGTARTRRAWTITDPSQLRVAAAYADLLEAQGETEARPSGAAVVAADPRTPAGRRSSSTKWTLDEEELEHADDEPADVAEAPEVVERLPEDDEDLGADFNAQVEAEVAELLGETEPPASEGPSED